MLICVCWETDAKMGLDFSEIYWERHPDKLGSIFRPHCRSCKWARREGREENWARRTLNCSKIPGQVQPLVKSPIGVQCLPEWACLRTTATLRTSETNSQECGSTKHTGESKGQWVESPSFMLLLQILVVHSGHCTDGVSLNWLILFNTRGCDGDSAVVWRRLRSIILFTHHE